jgi:serine/threonine protein kinase/tetratricopeptide (TPR) repeat protein
MIGETLSHYTILEKIGEGGMGVVYKAHDTKLNRVVALKLLPPSVTLNADVVARFTNEAQAAASLNHPNICTIHAIEETESHRFIVMEFVEGSTIRQQVPFKDFNAALSAAIVVGEALQEAHVKGIVHRDIKADNIMLTSKGQIKVMDFGLAKLRGSLKLTRTSSTIGTLAYMAPEQIQGGEVDTRSDIFSFGVLLFEMLTGRMPFRGEHEAAMMYSILHEQPESLQAYLPECPSSLLHVMAKVLEKDPGERYQSMADLVVDLRRLKRDTTPLQTRTLTGSDSKSTNLGQAPYRAVRSRDKKSWVMGGVIGALILAGGGAVLWLLPSSSADHGRKTLAVLPFENLAEPEKEYFSDGITEEITTRLSGLSGLGVIARSSAKEYKKSAKPLGQIGEELGVEYVLMGTVRWSTSAPEGPRVRVSPELIKVNDGLQIWSQTFDAPFSDAFTMQSSIATEVARALDVTLLQPETESLSEQLTESAEAYDFYLRGIEFSSRGNGRSDMETALRLFERAIAVDERFAAAYAQLSILHSDMYWFYYDRTEERVLKCLEAADRALELAPRLSEAYAAKAWYYYHCNLDYEKALEQFSIALKYQPNNANVFYGIAAVRRRQGMMREAVDSFKKAVSGNPRAADINRQLGETLTLIREYEEADRTYDRTLLLETREEDSYQQKAKNLLLWKGDLKGARAVYELARTRKVLSRPERVIRFSYMLDVLSGEYKGAWNVLNIVPMPGDAVNEQFAYLPLHLMRAELSSLENNAAQARRYYDSARVHLEAKLRTNPSDERYHSALGLAYAGLGRRQEAIREGERAVQILPVTREAWKGSFRLVDLARIYAMAGEPEKAIDLLEQLLSMPSEISRPYLRIDPAWRYLRGNERFEALVRE